MLASIRSKKIYPVTEALSSIQEQLLVKFNKLNLACRPLKGRNQYEMTKINGLLSS